MCLVGLADHQNEDSRTSVQHFCCRILLFFEIGRILDILSYLIDQRLPIQSFCFVLIFEPIFTSVCYMMNSFRPSFEILSRSEPCQSYSHAQLFGRASVTSFSYVFMSIGILGKLLFLWLQPCVWGFGLHMIVCGGTHAYLCPIPTLQECSLPFSSLSAQQYIDATLTLPACTESQTRIFIFYNGRL